MMIAIQAVVVSAALVALTLSPPASGKLLLVPWDGTAPADILDGALAGGAALLGPGPLPGSLVVIGDRLRIARQLGKRRVLILAGPTAGCGPIDAPGYPA